MHSGGIEVANGGRDCLKLIQKVCLELVSAKEGRNAKLNIMREYLQAYILRKDVENFLENPGDLDVMSKENLILLLSGS